LFIVLGEGSMAGTRLRAALARLSSEYGMIFVLLLLCAFFSYVTWDEQHLSGAAAGEQLAADLLARRPEGGTVLIVARDTGEDRAFAETLQERLRAGGWRVLDTVTGSPRDARRALERLAKGGQRLEVIACNDITAGWAVLQDRGELFPSLAHADLVYPPAYGWPSFLTPANLRNITSQIAVIAILAVGMTFVIISGGIDLSVGSLIALGAVATTLSVSQVAGGTAATPAGLFLCALAGIAVCAAVGLFSGLMVTLFDIPSFIVTLAMMLVARGLAFQIVGGQEVIDLPASFLWLGRGADLLGIPNPVVLMACLYALAYVLMTRMTLGRYIYAVGGNVEAARLSGVPVRRVLLFVYTLNGALAGLGGVVRASELNGGSPRYGEMYELYVIAAVVLGGTSLRGGQGQVLGTLIGALIMAVMQNGMNLTGVTAYPQMIILGLVILGAVLADTLKRGAWRMLLRRG
jgi:ribose transport system permease protein